MKEIKDLNEQRDLAFMDQKTQHSDLYLTQLQSKSEQDILQIKQADSKIYGRDKGIRVVKTIWKMNKVGGITLSYLKFSIKAIVTKTVW